MMLKRRATSHFPLATLAFTLLSAVLSIASLVHARLDLPWRALHASDAFRSEQFWLLVVPATLLHSSWHHFLPNIVLGALLGAAVERRLHATWFVALVFVWIMIPTGLELLASGRPQIGISGVDYAFLGFLLPNPPRVRRSVWLTSAVALIAWLVAGIVFPISPDNPPGNFAHSTGLLLGLAAGILTKWKHNHPDFAPNPSQMPPG